MELIHTLNGQRIDEPIGYDNLKTTIKRGNYHGMSAELSVGSVEFYGKAHDIIKSAYDTDIDTEVTYKITTDTGETVYEGVCDLSTCTEQTSDYRSISCNVGEVGIKTTFNNRTDTDVDLNANKTTDGDELVAKPTWRKVLIPRKSIIYTNYQTKTGDDPYAEKLTLPVKEGSASLGRDYSVLGHAWLNLKLNNIVRSEFGYSTPMFYYLGAMSETSLSHVEMTDVQGMYNKGDGFTDTYGKNVIMHVKYKLDVAIRYDKEMFGTIGGTGRPAIQHEAMVLKGNITYNGWGERDETNIIAKSDIAEFRNDNHNVWQEMHIEGEFDQDATDPLWLGIYMTNLNTDGAGLYSPLDKSDCEVWVREGSYFEAKIKDNITTDNIKADVTMTKDALDAVVGAISENQLECKSNWYGYTFQSPLQPSVNAGPGAMKAITNGYKIRGLYTDESKERNMAITFKTLIDSLNAMDCIGWGFSQEGGKTCVRVEPWTWFYNDQEVLRINDPNTKTRSVDTDRIVTKFTIGYKRYDTTDDYGSIDNVHSERTFASGVKAVATEKEALSSIIADNYCIEETRRAAFQKDKTQEFKYDESVFVLQLQGTKKRVPSPMGGYEYIAELSVAKDANVESGITFPEELYNTRLTPRQCAERWAGYLFQGNGSKDLKFSSGKVNYEAVLQTTPKSGDLILEAGYDTMTAENEDIAIKRSILKAETLEFEYPITITQYNAVKANPYGLVYVDGEPGWIKEFTYSFEDGMASFKLIPKYTE